MTPRPTRRMLLASSAAMLIAPPAGARTLQGGPSGRPWREGAADPPTPLRPGPYLFFTPEEAEAVGALVDRLIPGDELGPSAREAGCVVFIDRQLAGSYGRAERLYMRPPFATGTPAQGVQSPVTPALQYREALAALATHVRAAFVDKTLPDLAPAQLDTMLAGLETGQLRLDGADARSFFDLLLQNTMEGYFADPLYGGNRGMAGWTMLGFPGARYDYRAFVARHDEHFPLPPVGLLGRPDWALRGP